MAKRGLAPFSIPVIADDTRCSANGNIVRGNANHSNPSQTTEPQSPRSTGFREEGNNASVANPTQIRMKQTPFGPSERSPSAMNRNDAPEIRPGITSSSQPVFNPPLS